MPSNINNSDLILTANKQFTAWEMHIRGRLNQIQKYEDMYSMKAPKRLKGRFNIPLPILSGFIDTFKSKIDEAPSIDFIPNSGADIKVVKKVEQVWLQEKSDSRGKFNDVDDSVKHLALFCGRGTYKYYAESDPKYKSNFEHVDYYDHIFEPQGGSELENHLFTGQTNIFKTRSDIEKGIKSGRYDKGMGGKMLKAGGNNDFKDTVDELEDKNNRLIALGLQPTVNNFVGSEIFNLTEMCLRHKGERWYIFYDKKSLIPLRIAPLKDVFESELYPYVSFATNKDPLNYMSKAPCDDNYSVAEGQTELFNQAMDNMQKRNWGMRGVDTSVIKNVNQLKWRPDGIVEFDGARGNLNNSLIELQTPENTNQVVNLISFLDNFMGSKTGITAGIQGQSEKDKKVGVFFGELEQAADRINAVSKQYRRAHAEIARRFICGLNEHLNEEYIVKLIGEKGVEWTSLKNDEMTEFDISTSGGSEEAQANEVKRQKRGETLGIIASNPELFNMSNKKWFMEELLRKGEYEDEDIRTALDTDSEGGQEIIHEADKAIEEIMLGKKVPVNRGATTGYIKRIIDFSYDKDIKEEKFNELMEFARNHMEIALKNAERKADELFLKKMTQEIMEQPISPEIPAVTPGGGGGQPAPRGLGGGMPPKQVNEPLSPGGVGEISAGNTGAVTP